ncbi:ATP-dependent Clp protease proteolytic subunit [Cereibacter sphaeroides]|uniref:phage major capsid protein n=1 Tax=Cereibacter sphaeroides TaxID=1063 RepID=UPI001F3C02B2|nr:ATP-dependent Clp protease proteolytic subunit [Cereibacter sphaeroides]MCE6951694.1 ATP-dependent Clp protease proteolytic subunit [Cereibacter sphaeroides]
MTAPVFHYSEVTAEQSAALTDFLDHNRGAVTIIVNSAGGSAMAGAADAAAVEAHGQVTAKGRGVVASAATLPFIAAKQRLLHPACAFMIHDPAVTTGGTAADLRGTADALDAIAATYRDFYARRTGQPAARITEMMAAETWLAPADAVALGFADALEEPAEDLPAVACFDPTRFRNPPPYLLAAMAAQPKGSPTMNDMTPGPTADAKVRRALLKAGFSTDAAPQFATMMARTPATIDLERLAGSAKAAKLAAEDLLAIIEEVTDPAQPTPDPTARAAELIVAAWAAKGDNAVMMPGPEPRATIGMSWDAGPGFVAKMAEGLSAKITGSAPSPMGREAATMTLADIAMTCARRAGLRPFDAVEAVRMASHSTSDFPLILENSMTNVVGKEVAQRMPDLARASREIPRSDYRSGKVLSLSATAMPGEVKEGGEIKHVSADEKGEIAPQLRDFAALFNISNKAMVNDSTATGMLQDMGRRMAEGAVERFRAVLLEPLLANSGAGMTMADGKAMFHADHGNLAASAASINVTSLSAARLALRKAKDKKGALRPVEPWALVVPAELETVAQQVLAEIAAAAVSDVNPFGGKLELIVEPGLTSATGWYLIGAPDQNDGLAHAFLDGQAAPRIETRAGWETLGMEFRLTWAVDAKFIGTSSWFRNAG